MERQTYWVGLFCDPDVLFPWVDAWKTGEGPQGHFIWCFAIRAKSEEAIHDLLLSALCGGSYEIDFIEPKPWKTFGDFAGPNTRFRMAEKYLKDEIDTVAKCRLRLEKKP